MSSIRNKMTLKSCSYHRKTIILVLLLCIILSSTKTVCFGWMVQQTRTTTATIPCFKVSSLYTTIKHDNSRRRTILSMQQQQHQQQRRLDTHCFSTTTTSSSSDDIVTSASSSVREKSTTMSNGATDRTTDTISIESTSTDNEKEISAVETEIKNSTTTAESSEVTKNDNIVETDNNDDDSDDDDDQYEYIEYDTVTENDYIGSEWLLGTNWNNNPDKISETWVRLTVDNKSGKNIAIWGDNNRGTWNFDIASQFLSISKEYLIKGKDIWACTIDDYYYMSGTIRGWSYWLPASVLGQWQARRLNINKDEENPGTAPWFSKSTTNTDTTTTTDDASTSTD